MFLTKIRNIPRGDVQNTTYKAYALSVGMSVSRIQRFVRKGIHRARGRGSDASTCECVSVRVSPFLYLRCGRDHTIDSGIECGRSGGYVERQNGQYA
jgi:hypothetical protein